MEPPDGAGKYLEPTLPLGELTDQVWVVGDILLNEMVFPVLDSVFVSNVADHKVPCGNPLSLNTMVQDPENATEIVVSEGGLTFPLVGVGVYLHPVTVDGFTAYWVCLGGCAVNVIVFVVDDWVVLPSTTLQRVPRGRPVSVNVKLQLLAANTTDTLSRPTGQFPLELLAAYVHPL
jgi:hypothetical protein